MAGFPYGLSDGTNLSAPFNLAANDNGQVALIGGTNLGHNRLALIEGTAIKTIALFNGSAPNLTASPGGGTFAGLNDLAINDAGQVMISASVTGGPGGLFLYDGTKWNSVCLLNACRFDNDTITSVSNLRASNNRFCALLSASNGFTRVDCWDGVTPTGTLARRGEISSDGTETTSLNSFDVNRKGDIAVVANTNLGGPNVFLKTADGYYTVQSAPFPPEDGVFLVSAYTVELHDDRRVYLIGQDYLGRMVVYAADPQF